MHHFHQQAHCLRHIVIIASGQTQSGPDATLSRWWVHPQQYLLVVCVTLGDQQENLFFSWRSMGREVSLTGVIVLVPAVPDYGEIVVRTRRGTTTDLE